MLALAWAIAWAPFGVLTGMILDPDGTMDEPWIALGVFPGFLSALVFSAVLGFTYGRRRLDELSPERVAVWGALSGLLVMLPSVTSLLGTPNTEHVLWRGRFVILGAVTLLSAVSAVGSVLLARKTKERVLRDGGAHVA